MAGFALHCGVLAALMSLSACGSPEPAGPTPIELKTRSAQHPLAAHLASSYPAVEHGGLETVLEQSYLRVLTSNNSFDYFIHRGEPGGYQYEMVRAFVEALNRKYRAAAGDLPIQFELLPVASDLLVSELRAGRGDMIAARLTITPLRSDEVAFSVPYKEVDEQVMTRLDPAGFGSVDDLAGQRFIVRRNSSYYASLVALNRKFAAAGRAPVVIEFVPEELETEAVLQWVASGKADFTLVDSVLSEFAGTVFEGVSALPGVALREDAQIAWATPLGSDGLLAEIDDFLPSYGQGSLLGNLAVAKYFHDSVAVGERLAQSGPGDLSGYDALFRTYSEEYGFDWRLIAALAYQESAFAPDAHNPSGATGLLQIKPVTAQESYVDIPDVEGEQNADNNIHAGVKYLAWIKQRYFEPEAQMNERDRIRMALAAYNSGPATLLAARERARDMGLDPDRWFRNVELALLEMNKPEPVRYVSEVNKRYVSYVMLGVQE
jgi:membrane-bound lytic murein transglycosylase MltF